MMISLIGMPGCGKTSVGKKVANILHMSFIDVDQFIVEHYGPIDDLFKIGEAHFRSIEKKALKTCLKEDYSILSTGGGIIIDEENRNILKNKTKVIFINRDIEHIISSTHFNNRPLLKNDISKIHDLYNKRIKWYQQTAHYEVKSNNVFNDTVKLIVEYVKSLDNF